MHLRRLIFSSQELEDLEVFPGSLNDLGEGDGHSSFTVVHLPFTPFIGNGVPQCFDFCVAKKLIMCCDWRPKRPDAAVFVAAKDDAYASADSTEEIHRYWQGSEIRWLPGGHVSSYIFRMNAFCGAIKDSLAYLIASTPEEMPCMDNSRWPWP